MNYAKVSNVAVAVFSRRSACWEHNAAKACDSRLHSPEFNTQESPSITADSPGRHRIKTDRSTELFPDQLALKNRRNQKILIDHTGIG